MRTTSTGPAAAFDTNEHEITDPEALRGLVGAPHGEDVCSEYIDDLPLGDIGLIGGGLRIAYVPETGRPSVGTECRAPRALRPRELEALIEDTRAQWSDGIGEGAFDAYDSNTWPEPRSRTPSWVTKH